MWLSRAALCPLYHCEYAHAQCVAPKDVGPAPAPGHDTWPTNLLHPHSAAAPCCRPLPPPRERDRDREANSSGWDGMPAELSRNRLAVCGRFVPDSKGALDQVATAVSIPAVFRLHQSVFVTVSCRCPITNQKPNVHHFSHRRSPRTPSADTKARRARDHRLTYQPKPAPQKTMDRTSSSESPARISHMLARVIREIHEVQKYPPQRRPSARGITCDVAMCIRNNAILAYGIAAVCTHAVLPAFLLCRPHPVQQPRITVTRSHSFT